MFTGEKVGSQFFFFLSGENSFHGANKATGSSADTGVLQDHGNPTGKKLNIKIFEALMSHDAQNDMVEMTGNVAVNKRGDSWLSKRVFFLTPQVHFLLAKIF